jgi:hypothetical protein
MAVWLLKQPLYRLLLWLTQSFLSSMFRIVSFYTAHGIRKRAPRTTARA